LIYILTGLVLQSNLKKFNNK